MEICISISARLMLGRKFYVSKSIGLAYSWKEIYVSNLQKGFLLKLPEVVDLTKTQPCKYLVYVERGNPGQELRVHCANNNIL